MKEVVLCAAKRTPIGSFGGSLSIVPAPDLGAHAIRAVLKDAGVPAETIDEVILGCVLTAGLGQAPARQAMIKAGLPLSTQAMTINKVCSSGLKAILLAATNVRAGNSEAVIAGGMENMSLSPYLLPALRAGARLGHTAAEDSMIRDGLWDPYKDYHMGNAAELCATECNLSREAQDEFAIESYRRANAAIEAGHFKNEIEPLTIQARKTELVFEDDEEPGKGRPDKVPVLRPAFKKDGTVTAANASSINDGAAAMLVCSEEYANQHNLKPLARVVAEGWHSQEPEWFTTAPVGAVEKVLERAGRKIEEIDCFEINEAFSAVALACSSKLGLDLSKVNVNGGAVAIGHPIGASGARILTTLLYTLEREGLKSGIAAICNGGGEATSILVERV